MFSVLIAIIEDQEPDLALLHRYLDQYLNSAGIPCTITRFSSGEAFLECHTVFQLVFLDIELPGISGIETARQLRTRNNGEVIILVTNMVQYAIHGYSVSAADYIVKPVLYEQLAVKMPEYISRIRRRHTHILIHIKNDVFNINIQDIRYIEVFRHEVIVHLNGRNLKCYRTLKEFEKELEGFGFAKCSQSCLINLNFVQCVEGNNILVDGKTVAISRRERKAFLDAFTRYEKEW